MFALLKIINLVFDSILRDFSVYIYKISNIFYRFTYAMRLRHLGLFFKNQLLDLCNLFSHNVLVKLDKSRSRDYFFRENH